MLYLRFYAKYKTRVNSSFFKIPYKEKINVSLNWAWASLSAANSKRFWLAKFLLIFILSLKNETFLLDLFLIWNGRMGYGIDLKFSEKGAKG